MQSLAGVQPTRRWSLWGQPTYVGTVDLRGQSTSWVQATYGHRCVVLHQPPIAASWTDCFSRRQAASLLMGCSRQPPHYLEGAGSLRASFLARCRTRSSEHARRAATSQTGRLCAHDVATSQLCRRPRLAAIWWREGRPGLPLIQRASCVRSDSSNQL